MSTNSQPTAVPLTIRFAQNGPLVENLHDYGQYDEERQMSENGAALASTTGTGSTAVKADHEYDNA